MTRYLFEMTLGPACADAGRRRAGVVVPAAASRDGQGLASDIICAASGIELTPDAIAFMEQYSQPILFISRVSVISIEEYNTASMVIETMN